MIQYHTVTIYKVLERVLYKLKVNMPGIYDMIACDVKNEVPLKSVETKERT